MELLDVNPVPLVAALLDLHTGWAWVMILSNGLAGLWALGANWLPALRTRALWWFTVLAELTVFVQVGFGVGLVAGQKIEAPQFHMFYGFVAIIAVGILYSYRFQMRHRLYLLYGLGGLFIMGLGIRALLVGRG
ncbi:MAG TPA: hypothetical protein VM345_02895 [Acidimicrobiales bacterium]|nr:hypothetical protein [Acidimicrobiales bacterium]